MLHVTSYTFPEHLAIQQSFTNFQPPADFVSCSFLCHTLHIVLFMVYGLWFMVCFFDLLYFIFDISVLQITHFISTNY